MMQQTREQCFAQLRNGKAIHADGWLGKLRLAAQAGAQDFPSSRHDDWRLTDLTPLFQHAFQPAATYARLSRSDIAAWSIPGTIRLVFVDGSYDAGLSDLALAGLSLARGAVVAGPLTERLGDTGVEAHFSRQIDPMVDAFAALNTSQFDDGAWVRVDGEVSAPIHILHVATRRDTPSAVYPRALVLLQPNSRATLIEDYAGMDGALNFSSAVTEIVLQDHARLQHVRIQRETANAFHFGHCAVVAGRGSSYVSTVLAFGARLSRLALQVSLQAEDAEAVLNGLALISGRQLADTHTLIDHVAPRCRSAQLNKCIADGAAHGVFSGKIIVRPGAAGTVSAQTSRNLLLSGKAHIDAQPQLEIFNDDVSCRHGATVGQLDAEALFFLKSRGLDEQRARRLLTHAFAAEIIGKIPVPGLAAALGSILMKENP